MTESETEIETRLRPLFSSRKKQMDVFPYGGKTVRSFKVQVEVDWTLGWRETLAQSDVLHWRKREVLTEFDHETLDRVFPSVPAKGKQVVDVTFFNVDLGTGTIAEYKSFVESVYRGFGLTPSPHAQVAANRHDELTWRKYLSVTRWQVAGIREDVQLTICRCGPTGRREYGGYPIAHINKERDSGNPTHYSQYWFSGISVC